MLIEIEKVLIDEKPDFVLVYGDTNSTLAGALAAKKLNIPIAHIEAGLRSFNMQMPEEINRIVTDRISDILFCPTETAVRNLRNEGIFNEVHNVGDVMYESIIVYRKKVEEKGVILSLMDLKQNEYVLATIHRAENTDDVHRLKNILSALNEISKLFTVVFPIHPRTFKEIKNNGLEDMLKNIYCIKPLSYFDMMNLEQFARVILTDSGGVQKEAFFHGVPSITLRDETEWIETLQGGWNTIAGTNTESIMKEFDRILNTSLTKIVSNPFGDGTSSKDMLNVIFEKFRSN